MSQALRGLIDSASRQDHKIALLWKAIDSLSARRTGDNYVPHDAARKECFEATKINELVGK